MPYERKYCDSKHTYSPNLNLLLKNVIIITVVSEKILYGSYVF